jgi:enterochelin esterase-like enzyme
MGRGKGGIALHGGASAPAASSNHPRLRQLERDLSRSRTSSRTRIWKEFAKPGLPLIAPIPRERGRVRVTFVWNPRSPVTAPTIYTPIADPFKGEMELRQLGSTGVWYRSLELPAAARALYGFSPLPLPGSRPRSPSWPQYFRSLRPDPHHSARLTMAKDPDDPEDVRTSVSALSLPQAPRASWNDPRTPSFWRASRLRSRSRHLSGTRSVQVFLPPGSRSSTFDGNLVIALDGVTYTSAVPTQTIVQNLVQGGRIARTVVVAVGNAPGRRDAELLHNPHFARFLQEDLLPSLRTRFGITIEPSRTLLAGSSLGGLEAAHTAFLYPETFGGVLAQSGAFMWSDSGKLSGPPTLMREFARAPRGPTRFYLSAGTFEDTVFPGTRMSLLSGVRQLRDVLIRKGYPVTYEEFVGGHDHFCWSSTLANGLLALLGATPARRAHR